MTNDNLTLLGVLVDRSGSMNRIKADMEASLNSLVKEQYDAPGALLFTLGQFNTQFETVWALGQTPTNTEQVYTMKPYGGTALNDATAQFVHNIGNYLKFLPEHQRPSKVVIVIVTDGEENSSREYDTKQIKDLIDQQKSEWKWEFIFLGTTDIDAFKNAGDIGVMRGQTMSFSPAQTRVAFAATSANISSYRETADAASLGYTDVQRLQALDEDDK